LMASLSLSNLVLCLPPIVFSATYSQSCTIDPSVFKHFAANYRGLGES
jgi:hypothetical protein